MVNEVTVTIKNGLKRKRPQFIGRPFLKVGTRVILSCIQGTHQGTIVYVQDSRFGWDENRHLVYCPTMNGHSSAAHPEGRRAVEQNPEYRGHLWWADIRHLRLVGDRE